MPTGPGLVHEDEATAPDDPEAEINKGEWNKAHRVKLYLDITPSSGAPSPPIAGLRLFFTDSGTSPNRRITIGLQLPDGTELPINDWFV